MVFVVFGGPDVDGGRPKNGLDEIDAEEAEEVYEGGDQGYQRHDLGQVDDAKRSRVADLLAPPRQQEVDHREEDGEEHRIGQVQRQRQSVRGSGLLLIIHDHSNFHRRGGFVRRSLAHVHREMNGIKLRTRALDGCDWHWKCLS